MGASGRIVLWWKKIMDLLMSHVTEKFVVSVTCHPHYSTWKGCVKNQLLISNTVGLGNTLINKQKKYTFVGVGNGGFLFWDDSQKHWKLENIEDKKIFAILNETESSYPFGTHFWYIFNDNCKNLGVAVAPNTYRTELSFNVCKEDMFNCHDGTWYVNLPYFCNINHIFF